MSQMNRQTKWSMVRYDLKTGLDIQKLPCLVKVADSTSEKTLEQRPSNGTTYGCAIKFEKEICVCFVRALVLELADVNWFVQKKGAEFVRSYSMMAESEILIPLEYTGKVKLYDRFGGQKYFSIREVIEDFPRYVRVEKDTVCASPGIQTAQVVEKGTILELDRVTKSMQAIRGSRETYLICKDRVNSRELAFRQMAPVHFTKVQDMTKECLKDFIERLPLPQTVEFVNVNPYDVISVDDDDARDLLVMLSGAVELLGLHMEHFVAGRVNNGDTNVCDIIAIPARESVLETFSVHLPVGDQNSRGETDPNAGDYVDLTVTDDGIYACLQQKLYLRYAEDNTPLVLRVDNSASFRYEIEEMPDTPPIPEKLDDHSLKHTNSVPHCGAVERRPEGGRRCSRKRFFSANDIEGQNLQQLTEREQHGLKPLLSQLTRKMKSTASQILFGIEAFSGAVDQDLERCGKLSSVNRGNLISRDLNGRRTGFVCYLDIDLKTVQSGDSDAQVSDTKRRNIVKEDEVVYAAVDVFRKTKRAIQVTHKCHVCRETANTIQKIPEDTAVFANTNT